MEEDLKEVVSPNVWKGGLPPAELGVCVVGVDNKPDVCSGVEVCCTVGNGIEG